MHALNMLLKLRFSATAIYMVSSMFNVFLLIVHCFLLTQFCAVVFSTNRCDLSVQANTTPYEMVYYLLTETRLNVVKAYW